MSVQSLADRLVGRLIQTALLPVACCLCFNLAQGQARAPVPAAAPPAAPAGAAAGAPQQHWVQELGIGDTVSITVYGQPDMSATVTIAEDGTMPVAMAGPVHVSGLSPSNAAKAIENALRNGKFFVDPHVTLMVVQGRSQRVSVLGAVGKPGLYPIEPNTTIFDLLAEAGGVAENGSDVVYVLRIGQDGKESRFPINLKGMSDANRSISTPPIKGGDSVFVPPAEQFYIYGEVSAPGKFRVEPGMTVVQAIARAGGISARGSLRRIEVKRKRSDGSYATSKGNLNDLVQADDVIRVKESIF
jgi:polysaccharide export outer membrane protein